MWQKCRARDTFTLATLVGLWYSGEELCRGVDRESRDHWSLSNAESIFSGLGWQTDSSSHAKQNYEAVAASGFSGEGLRMLAKTLWEVCHD